MPTRALAINDAIFGAKHASVATDLNNLAALYCSLNRHAEAESLLRRALAIDLENHGPKHPNVAFALHNLAGVYWGLHKPAEAIPLYERALAIIEEAYGTMHQTSQAFASHLAQCRKAVSVTRPSLPPNEGPLQSG